MKIFIPAFVFFCLHSLSAFAQHEADNWYFGDSLGISFTSGTPVPLSDGKTPANGFQLQDKPAVISDKTTGKLLFYTEGSTIWNGNHDVMNNGTGLKGGISLIVPNPANAVEYYIFTVDRRGEGGKMYYNIVSIANPTGDVILKNKVLADSLDEKLTGTLDCSGTGFWVVAMQTTGLKNFNFNFLSFHLTSLGVDTTPVLSTFRAKSVMNLYGTMKFSPNGSKLAATSGQTYQPFGLFDFNRITGEFTNYRIIGSKLNVSGFCDLSFSPDNTKLYLTSVRSFGLPDQIHQYEVNLRTTFEIQNSEYAFTVSGPNGSGSMQLAPDGKIYLYTSMFRVINNPNEKGSACNYQDDASILNSRSYAILPNFMDYLFGDRSLSSHRIDTITICKGSSIKIGTDPLPGYTYSWTPATGLDNPNIANPNASPGSTTTYQLKTSASNCEGYQMIVVRIADKPVIDPVPPVCWGSSVELSTINGDSYLWSPSESLDTATKASPIATPKVNTRYKVLVTQGYCIDSAFVDVTVVAPFTANAGADKVICPGTSIQIGDTAKPGESYRWYPEDGLDNPTKPNPTATPPRKFGYVVEVTKNGCKQYDTVVVAFANPQVSADVTICKGSSTELTASGGKSYVWSPISGLNNSKIANPIASPSVTTKYRVLISNDNCVDSAFVTVTVVPAIIANAGTDKTICPGSSVELGAPAEADLTYSWQPETKLDDPTKANPICTATKTSKYILTVTSSLGCKAYDTVLVTIKNISANAGVDKTVCTGAITQIGSLPETGNTYLWQPSTYLDDPTKSNPRVTPDGSTRYILKVTNQQGCIGYDTVFVTVSNTLTAKVSNDTALCLGSSVQLLASGGSDYEWSPITGLDNPNIPNPIASPTVTTTYKVRVSSGSTCEDFASVTVTVNPYPIANAGIDLSSCRGERLQLGASPEKGNTYSWQPATGLDDPTKSNPNATPTATTEYILTVTNGTGCSSKDTVLVTVGNIKAIVSNDTGVCSGTSVRLYASGGSAYKWIPSTGLDNPNSATPLCTVSSKTEYKVVVMSGFCIDSAYTTVDIVSPPTSNAGPDQSPCKGDPTQLGVAAQVGNTYSWQPTAGLDDPTKSNPIAAPDETTKYILTVTNGTGCSSKDTIVVTVNPRNEYTFTLSPSVVTIIPGQQFQTVLNIPSGIQSWKVHLDYDNLIVKFGSIAQMSSGIAASAKEKNGTLSLNGTGENGTITLTFNSYLPYSTDTTFAMKLTVDSASIASCETVASKGNTLELGIFCGRRIRTISSTGKNYFLTTKENGVNFGIGLPGNVRLELYDYTGLLKEILTDGNMEAGEYSIDFDVPIGVYFCKIKSGMYNDVQKVIVVQ